MRTSSAIAGLLLDRNGRNARHVSFDLPSGAMLVLPKSGRARRGALAIYNPQRVTGFAAKALMASGFWRGRETSVTPGPLEELQAILAAVIGDAHAQCGFYFGATGIYSKTVILVMDRSGRPLAYGKLADLPAARESVRHESSTLDRLANASGLRGRIPRVVGNTRWRDFPLLVLSAGPSARAPRSYGTMQREFLTNLTNATRETGTLLDSPTWQDMTERLYRWRERLTPAWRDRYDWGMAELERRLGSARLELALAHRDFVCWNTRRNADGTLFVFDWEFSRSGSMPGRDFFHFHVALWAVLGRPLNRDAVDALISAAKREALAPAVDLLLAYLLDVALFQHDAAFGAGEDGHPMLNILAQGIDVLRVS
jgi:hypothetical protein